MSFVISALNTITYNHTLLGMTIALGLGVGIGITVFRSPDSLAASSNLFYNQQNIENSSIKYVEFIDFLVVVKDDKKKLTGLLPQYKLQQVNLNQNQQTYLRANLALTNRLQQLNIGSQATLQYKNGQRKNITLIEVKTVGAEKILTASYQHSLQFIIYSPMTLIGDQIWIGVFR